MPSDLALINGDLSISASGDLTLASDLSAVVQIINMRLNTELGGCPSDSTFGLDFTLMDRSEYNSIIKTIALVVKQALVLEARISKIISIDVKPMIGRQDSFVASVLVNVVGSTDPYWIQITYPYVSTPSFLTTINNEVQTSLVLNQVKVSYDVFDVLGVWLATDVNKTGTNFYPGGYSSGNIIYLGSNLPQNLTQVKVTYRTFRVVGNTKIYSYYLEEATVVSQKLVLTKRKINALTGVWLDKSGGGQNLFYASDGEPGVVFGDYITLPENLSLGSSIVYVTYDSLEA